MQPPSPLSKGSRILQTCFLGLFVIVGIGAVIGVVAVPLILGKSVPIGLALFMGLWALIFAGVPLLMIVRLWKGANTEAAQTWPKPSGQPITAPGNGMRVGGLTAAANPKPAVGGGYLLAPSMGAGCAVVGMGLFTVMWNSIAWVIFSQAWSHREWVPTAFSGLFCLIGLVLVGLWIYQIVKAVATPRLELVLDRPRLALGQPAVLRWRVVGDARKLADLTLDLMLIEQCRYRRGTDTSVDHHLALSLPLWSKPEPSAEGQVAITIDQTHPPTFRAGDNQLVWSIRAKGTVHGLPDLSDEFPVEVDPSSSAKAALRREEDAPVPQEIQGVAILLPEASVTPGSATAGAVLWRLAQAPGSLRLHLGWQTAGKGSSDGERVATLSLPSTVEGGVTFGLDAPAAPITWPGTMLAIRWMLTVEQDGRVVAERELAVR